jgi:hypothetical protein
VAESEYATSGLSFLERVISRVDCLSSLRNRIKLPWQRKKSYATIPLPRWRPFARKVYAHRACKLRVLWKCAVDNLTCAGRLLTGTRRGRAWNAQQRKERARSGKPSPHSDTSLDKRFSETSLK